MRELFGDRVELHTLRRENLTLTAFERARDDAAFFKAVYGPTIVTRRNAEANGREAEFDEVLTASATSGTAAETARRDSRRSTWSSSAPAADGDVAPPVTRR